MTERPKPVPEWLVERLAAGDLDGAVAESVRSRLVARGEIGRLQQIEASNRELLAVHPTRAAVAEIERRLRASGERRGLRSERVSVRGTWAGLAVAVSVAAALLVALGVQGEAPSLPEAPSVGHARNPGITAKGLAPQLLVYRQRPEGAERLRADSRVQAGDVLQVAYVAAGRRYGVIASIDALGAVTLHLPEAPGSAVELKQGETPVPHAFELDASPGFERFVFASSNTPFTSASLVEALRSDKLQDLAASLDLRVFVARKGPVP